MVTKHQGIGRGLDALLLDLDDATVLHDKSNQINEHLIYIPILQLVAGQHQPRQNFKDESLEELSKSIQTQGVIQPIVVRSIQKNLYEIITGERRWRAAKLAGLNEIPALVRFVSDSDALAIALIENIQRDNLNPIEEATALQRLITQCQLTQEEVGYIVGKSRVAITNFLRLLNLEKEVKNLLKNDQINMGHARALLALEGNVQIDIAYTVLKNNLSVRQTEELVRKIKEGVILDNKMSYRDPRLDSWRQNLTKTFRANIDVKVINQNKGRITIDFNSLDELDLFVENFSKN